MNPHSFKGKRILNPSRLPFRHSGLRGSLRGCGRGVWGLGRRAEGRGWYDGRMSRKAESGSPPRGLSFPILNLDRWIRENRKGLVPPVSNRQLFGASRDMILFVSGGPNTRNDFHVNSTEELFYQLKGDIAVRVRPLDGSEPHDVIVREGEMLLLDRWVPHRPQRPPGTLGLIVEFPRGVDERGRAQEDALRWYCPRCDHLVHEVRWVLKRIDEDLRVIMNGFWGGPVGARTCGQCGEVIERAGAVELKGRRVSAVKKKVVKGKGAANPGRAGSASAKKAEAKKAPARKSSVKRAAARTSTAKRASGKKAMARR